MRPTAPQRATFALFAALLVLLSLAQAVPAAAQQGGGSDKPAVQAPAKADVEVRTEHKTTTWYTDPKWIVIGLVALVLVIVLLVVSGRSRTTVIKQ